ncbi:CPBP family intramembrane metalloprotease [Tissierella carlieri]|uniref:CPBP family intramembrane glutamic endopeptidase n=1 Tax=Tissierella carlieri TaxID=689904 RepID=UPI001C10DEAC|nr:CPBP family intramembrane glutamic endopeptidase [Tissierella carlieri]MBU5312817.1 CPBP family intramembrane metalloprotease [Tissierella carlieri]
MTSFLRVCLIPTVEEILIRGYVLGELSNKYGIILALLVSSILFALLHFNMVQTLSALICGLILGILYIYTGSIY